MSNIFHLLSTFFPKWVDYGDKKGWTNMGLKTSIGLIIIVVTILIAYHFFKNANELDDNTYIKSIVSIALTIIAIVAAYLGITSLKRRESHKGNED